MSARRFHQDGMLPPHGVGHDRWIFVFGSNTLGRHGKGAAYVARMHFGARHGCGEGFTGDAWAIPTKDNALRSLPLERIRQGVERFLVFARATQEMRYFVTRIGCGLAGYTDAEIAPMFANAPANCSFAEQWKPWLEVTA